jgi:ring-1,2-phenylacetyl-CoA epoxidase subunit PaaC
VDERELLLQIADDELVLGWRDSEWTGIAPFLEEDVAFSSIAQNEIGHARAFYELAAERLGTDADALAFDRSPAEYRCAPLVELRFVPDWGRTIGRRVLYEAADAVRLEWLQRCEDDDVRGLAAKIEGEERYHRMHAEMWAERLAETPQYRESVAELWPYALGLLPSDLRPALRERWPELPDDDPVERGDHVDEWPALWEEMTMVRRVAPGATW